MNGTLSAIGATTNFSIGGTASVTIYGTQASNKLRNVVNVLLPTLLLSVVLLAVLSDW